MDSNSTNTFIELGKTFQEKTLQALIFDKVWATSFVEIFDIESCFEYSYLKLIGHEYLGHYNKYKEFPSLDLLVSITSDRLKNNYDASLKGQIVTFLKKVAANKELGDLAWVKEKAYSFCRQQYMKKAILESTELLDKEDQYDQIVQIIKKAICTGTSPTCGLDFNNDVAARYSETFRNTIATGIQQLDSREILNGGLGSGELGIVIAISGVGKSHVLVQMGAQAMSQGKNVVHYTLELNERATGVRYDSHILGINSTDCKDNLPEILRFYQDNAGSLGRLFIKHLPPRTSTTNTIRAHIDRLYNKDIKPDLIVVDYAGIMKPTEKHSEVRFNLQQIVQDLKDLSEELQVPLWTAIQSNKEGASSEFIDITNMAEAFGQSFAADFVMGLSRKAENKSTGFGSLFLAKNRAGLDGILYKIHLDTARSRLRILSSVEAEELKEMSQKISASMADPSGQTIKSYKNTVSNNKNLFNKAVGGSR